MKTHRNRLYRNLTGDTLDKQALAYHRHMRKVSQEVKREGMDPRPTPEELSHWTASAACGDPISQTDTLRLLQEVRQLQSLLANLQKMTHDSGEVIADLAQENGELKSCARALINAMHEFPEGDWTEILAHLEKALEPTTAPTAAPGGQEEG